MTKATELLWSRNAVYEVLRAGRREVLRVEIAEGRRNSTRLQAIERLCAERGIALERVGRGRFDKLRGDHEGVVAEARTYPYADLPDLLQLAQERGEPPFVLLLDALQDPQNFGTLLRTAEAVGVHGAVIPLAHTVEVTPAVVNASAGATEHLLITRSNLAQAMDALKAENVWIVGLDPGGDVLDEAADRHLRGALGLVVGSEGEGLRALVRAKCDVRMRLPMRGQVESLNASVAGSIAIYLAYLARQRESHGARHA